MKEIINVLAKGFTKLRNKLQNQAFDNISVLYILLVLLKFLLALQKNWLNNAIVWIDAESQGIKFEINLLRKQVRAILVTVEDMKRLNDSMQTLSTKLFISILLKAVWQSLEDICLIFNKKAVGLKQDDKRVAWFYLADFVHADLIEEIIFGKLFNELFMVFFMFFSNLNLYLFLSSLRLQIFVNLNIL